MTRIAVLTEEALAAADVEHIMSLHPDAEFRVLVPADTERNLLASIVDHLSMGELREVLDDVLDREPPATAELTATEQLERSLAAFAAAGAPASGEVVADDPLPELAGLVADLPADEVVIVTTPHALEDTFHTDWASRARDELRVPVLHLYAGTSELG
ncbi:hypothetical protein Q6348_11880 [Isoptericola sp. b441]|uniref:Indole-3-glycerol phosphate synthase n=1 Tax=Actinotalea lenta TaxID=3064654 RepID=A0ABT9DAI3_9CELL|nr:MULTISPECIES: hypothetical protein [unclassified Isoptericola]MDO8107895.1 hypothetical protein [Isoptericola sp. b441]MDO8120437.1 hypothetical protein [Isoptericola sp. b490]